MDPTTAAIATEVAETVPLVTEVPDYMPLLEEIAGYAAVSADASVYITGFLLFFVVVALCYFGYKFMRIFF